MQASKADKGDKSDKPEKGAEKADKGGKAPSFAYCGLHGFGALGSFRFRDRSKTLNP